MVARVDEAWVCLQGASFFLQSLAKTFGAELMTQLPVVKQVMLQPLTAPPPAIPDPKQATDSLHILQIIGPVVHEQLLPEVLQVIPAVVHACAHAEQEVRQRSVCCAVQLAGAHCDLVPPALLRSALHTFVLSVVHALHAACG